MPQSGYIYILINPTLNGLVKIGKTSKTSEERAKELSSATGVPTQFIVAYDEFFDDIDLAENHVHEILKNMGHHVFPNKEFFDIPLKDAIGILNETRKYFTNIYNNLDSEENIIIDEYEDEVKNDSSENSYDSILEEAYKYKFGEDDYFQDDYEAFNLYEKAYKLGSGEACYELGYSYMNGEGCSKNERIALKFLKEGVKRNYLKCYLLMYQTYIDLNEEENAEKSINMLFDKIKDIDSIDRIYILQSYLFNQSRKNQVIDVNKIKPYLNELIIFFEKTITERMKTENLNNPNVVSLLDRFRTILNFLKNNQNNGEFIIEKKLDDEELDDPDNYQEEKKPYHDLLVEAKNYFFGLGDYMRDTEKAVNLFVKAAELGSGEASYELGYIVNSGIDVKINKRLALEFLQNGVEKNYLRCYLLMAEIYLDLHQPDNSEKCINKYFEKLKNLEEADRLELLEEYLSNQLENNKEVNLEKIKDYKQELMIYFEDSVQNSIKWLEEYKLTNDEILIELQKETLEKNIAKLELLKKI
ncbi:MAG: SEL1-like repeat protein [Bacteroidetes bacterium]|nr:SEL1-like repeat protein [Bacteroidota bacterium]